MMHPVLSCLLATTIFFLQSTSSTAWTTIPPLLSYHGSAKNKNIRLEVGLGRRMMKEKEEEVEDLFSLSGYPEENLASSVPTTASTTRRSVVQTSLTTMLLFSSSLWTTAPAAVANDDDDSGFFGYERNLEKNKLYYTIQIPNSLNQGQKPVKTHLDEVNFISDSIKGYQLGITVDPVRINSLKEFGSPEEVAARVVTAEVNRDGIFEVTLLKDPYQSDDGAYMLEYLSVGKRGNKHLINKIFIVNNLLYVLTAQAKEDSFKDDKSLQKEMIQALSSFRAS